MSDSQNEEHPNTGVMENRRLQAARPIEELGAAQLDSLADLDSLQFETTADLEPLDEIIGQDRAMSALEVGLGIRQEGYNIFAAGLTGTGKMETIKRSLQRRLDGARTPQDWVYVNNFEDPDKPWAMPLDPGQGKKLEKDLDRLVERLKEALPKAFRQQEFRKEKEELSKKYERTLEEETDRLRDLAKERDFEMTFTSEGQISFLPQVEGETLQDSKQLEGLSEQEKQRISEGEKDLAREVHRLMQDQRQMMQNLTEEVRGVERQFAGYVVTPMIEAIKTGHRGHERVLRYLDHVREHILDNVSDFRQSRPPQQVPPQLRGMLGDGDQEREMLDYKVNVVVDNSQTKAAPVVIEEVPNYRNLFGSIDRSVDRRGRLITNFTQIKAGSLLRANGGYLVFNIEDALTEPFVYKSLKRALKSSCIQLESMNPWLPFSTGELRPEPIRINTKVVVVGNPMVYYYLRFYDDEFASIFKIKADFGTEMPRGDKEQMQYARFVATIVRDEELKPFSRNAVAEVIRFGAKSVSDRTKLLTRFSEAADLIREADYFAGRTGSETVEGKHVKQALENRIYRSGRIAEKIRELIEEGTLLVDVSGERVGQINGLAVISLGDVAFGRPIRVTASVAMGSDGLINIEREAKLSGRTHDKAVLIITGFLRNRYGQERPLTLSASIAFEQTYSGIEGDSASAAEIYAMVSALAQVSIRQDIAITGSVNQWGDIQAIGGVNEKIEGFFDVCRTVGLTGRQGVCIPQSNVKNLVLRSDVQQAVTDGEFHIYPIRNIDEGLELLTGFKAGSPGQEETIHGRVEQRLAEMSERLRGLAAMRETRIMPAPPEQPEPPGPPPLPDDQR